MRIVVLAVPFRFSTRLGALVPIVSSYSPASAEFPLVFSDPPFITAMSFSSLFSSGLGVLLFSFDYSLIAPFSKPSLSALFGSPRTIILFLSSAFGYFRAVYFFFLSLILLKVIF